MKRYRLLPCWLCLLAGCQSWNSSVGDKLPWSSKPKVTESAYAAPTRIVAIWSDAVYTEPGRSPVRGVGGRLYFHDDKNQPVPVEGQLVVYGYDDSTATPAQTPSRKFVFTAEQFRERWSPTEMGASYSIWLPWDEAGGMKKTISLLPVFTASTGSVVMGTQSVSVLPGKTPPEAEMGNKKGRFSTPAAELGGTQLGGVQPAAFLHSEGQPAVNYASPASGEVPAPAGSPMRTTTIQLPPITAQRMILEQAAAPQNPAASSPPVRTGQPAAPATAAATGSPETLPPARFERPRYQVPGGATSLPGRGHAPSLPGPAAPLPGPPSGR